jgi:hypothetical protein
MNLRWVLGVALITTGCASASPIGVLSLASSGEVQATLTSIFFAPDPAALPAGICPGPLCWNGDVNTGTTLVFDSGPLLTQDGVLINGGQAFGSPPPPGAGLFDPFLQFASHPMLVFAVTGVQPGSANTNCVGLLSAQSCSIDVNGVTSPVVLQRQGSDTLLSIGFVGSATDGAGLSNWTGRVSATIPDKLPVEILELFCGVDDVCSAEDDEAGTALPLPSVSRSFFATASPVPEPSTILLFAGGAGFLLAGLARRKKRGFTETLGRE